MADQIKEMLVSLGFQTNDEQLKNFTNALETVSRSATALTSAVEKAATATVGAVQQMSDGLEQLFYQSQRAGTGAAALQSMAFGMQAIGLHASSAKEALAAFNMAIISNPGTEALFTSLTGKATRDASGQLRDTKAMYKELSAELDKEPPWLAMQRAGQFGLDPATYMQQRRNRPQEDAAEARLIKIQEKLGVSTGEATGKAVLWNTALRDLWGVFDTLGQKIKEDMQDKSLPALTAVHDYVMGHLPFIRSAVDTVERALDKFATSAIETGKSVYHAFADDAKFQKDVGRLGDSFGKVGKALEDAFGIKAKDIWKEFVKDVEWGTKQSVIQLTHFNEGLVSAIKIAGDLVKGDWAQAWEDFGGKSGEAFKAWHDQWEEFKQDWGTSNLPWTLPLQGLVELLNSADESLKSLSDRLGNSAAVQWIKDKFHGAVLTMGGSGSQADITPQMAAYIDTIAEMESGKNPHAKNPTPGSTAYGYTQFTNPTWSEAEAGMGRKLDRDSLADQKSATAWLAQKEWSRLHPGEDINKALLDPSRWAEVMASNNKRWEVLDFNRKGVHPGQLKALERLSANMEAQGSSAGMQNFGLGGDAGGMPVGATARPRNVNQTVNITNKVDASGHRDAHAAGESVVRAMPRANAQIIRDLGAGALGWQGAGG